MRRFGRRIGTGAKAVAMVAAVSLLAAGCGSGSDNDENDNSSNESSSQGGSFSTAIGEPSALFPPQACYASECSKVIKVLWSGLVEMKDQELVYRVAESIDSEDQQTWTIKLREGYEFRNGEPVNADAYIRAWNWASYAPNGAVTAGFFTRIEGYEALQGEKPEAEELSGLKKTGEYEFEVTLNAPFSQFPYMLLYKPAFSAVSQECLDNIKACNEGEMPIGNGPYQMAGPWKHNQSITVKRAEDYAGPDKGNADEIQFKIYTNMDTAFRDYQAGNIDIVNPVSSQVEQARAVAGDRVLQEDSSTFSYIGLPLYVDYLKDPAVRHALSLAIDRQTIIDQLLAGLGTPAQSVTSPIVPGGGGDVCDYCEYDPERAKEMMPDGALPDTITLWVNSGAGNDQWVQAVGNMWRETFGVDYEIKSLQFPEYLDTLGKGKSTGPYRLGWQMDFPSMVNYLKPIYFEGAPTNYSQYSSEEFEQLVLEGSAADTQEAALDKYTEATQLLLEDMPIIPISYGEAFYIYSENVDNVQYSALYDIHLSEVEVVS
jgi:oligopeptide transport system substrate-binding protein